MALERFQTWAWWVFLICYALYKYIAGGVTGFQVDYFLAVAFLVILTAVIPWYATCAAMRRSGGATALFTAVFLPLFLAALGLTIYFYVIIAPNFDGIALGSVLPRAVFPGVAISLILLIPRLPLGSDGARGGDDV